MIDGMIMEAVMRDSKALAVSSLKPKFIVGTGIWRMLETDHGDYVVFTDDFIDPDKAFTVLLLEDCELVEGEKLLLLTSVAYGDLECSLVLFRENAVDGNDE
ncbi:hypothetical protein X824_gp228 [Escherichia phage 4MG]|uniref:Hyphothetical protein n=1 Tax=Escherichia phage 4MG TaxID=1391428 RepID=V5KSK6_9CAUD|nr:hypothetical protein X824_gp228 [Escherichia phage 4MG]AGZ17595.1 hyphothetical protein [Escherichia phage 4MG]